MLEQCRADCWFQNTGHYIVFERVQWETNKVVILRFHKSSHAKYVNRSTNAQARLPKLATLCPLRKAKSLGRAQFRHSATYKTIQLGKLGSVIEVDACE